MKTCRDCGILKPLDSFTRDQRRADGAGTYCKSCFGVRRRASVRKHPRTSRRQRLKRVNWTPEQYDVAVALQGGVCANPACDQPATDADHDYDTLEPRAPLCNPCNVALGHVKENPDVLVGLAEYARQCQNVKRWVI